MSKLPVLSGAQLIKLFEKLGYRVVRTRGSHVCLHHPFRRPITIPKHAEIGKGLLYKILRDAEVSMGELLRLLQ